MRRYSMKDIDNIYKYWKYCECSDPDENDKYDPMSHKFLQDIAPDRFLTLEEDHDFGYVSWENDKLVINFQGSDDFWDWINNLRGLKLLNRDDVHDGWYFTAKKFRKAVKEIIEKYCEEHDFPVIIVCGHSRGGCIAKEIARYIAKHLKIEVTVYTYGSPMIGGKDLLKELRSLPINIYNVINGGDIVGKVPPKSFGYVEDGIKIKLKFKFWHVLPWMWKKCHCGYRKAIEAYIKK